MISFWTGHSAAPKSLGFWPIAGGVPRIGDEVFVDSESAADAELANCFWVVGSVQWLFRTAIDGTATTLVSVRLEPLPEHTESDEGEDDGIKSANETFGKFLRKADPST